jgi:hypothetical protein
LALALICGIAALVPGLASGPAETDLGLWMNQAGAQMALNALYSAKLLTLGGNRRRLSVMTYAFYVEVGAVGISIVVALAVAAGRCCPAGWPSP